MRNRFEEEGRDGFAAGGLRAARPRPRPRGPPGGGTAPQGQAQPQLAGPRLEPGKRAGERAACGEDIPYLLFEPVPHGGRELGLRDRDEVPEFHGQEGNLPAHLSGGPELERSGDPPECP